MAGLLPGSVGIKEINKDQVVVPFDWAFNAGKTARILTLKSGYILGVFSFEGIETPEITIPVGSTELSLPENVEIDGSLNVDTALTVNGVTTRGLGIIEEGSNTYGKYALYSNGMLICWGTATPTSWDGTFLGFNITSPYEFDDLSYSVGWSFATGGTAGFVPYSGTLHASTTVFSLAFRLYTGTYAQTNLSFIAIGRAAI